MAIESPQQVFERQTKIKHLLSVLKTIRNSSDFTLYHREQYTLEELRETLRKIQTQTIEALAEH